MKKIILLLLSIFALNVTGMYAQELTKKELKEQSLAMCLLQDMKLVNKRLYNTLIIVLLLWFATVVGFVYYINNYTVSKTVEYIETNSGSGL